jgi:hypothetical protein
LGVIGVLLIVTGLGVMAYGSLPIFVEAFKTSPAWGFGSLFLPVGLIFVAKHWEAAKKWFFIALAGWAILLAGVAVIFFT